MKDSSRLRTMLVRPSNGIARLLAFSFLTLAIVAHAIPDSPKEPVRVPPAPPPRQTPDNDPFHFAIAGGVTLESAAHGGDRLEIRFEPTVSVLPARISINLADGSIDQADLTLLRYWFLQILAYHRDLDARVEHDLEFIGITLPVFMRSAVAGPAHVRMTVSVGAETGYRWMQGQPAATGPAGGGEVFSSASGRHGVYFEPTAGIVATADVLNRVFATLYAMGTATTIGGGVPDYVSAVAGIRAGIGLDSRNQLRLVFRASARADGALARQTGRWLEPFAGVSLEWGAQPPVVSQYNRLRGRQ